jgi:uncharacterized membrane protein (DUF106 family)
MILLLSYIVYINDRFLVDDEKIKKPTERFDKSQDNYRKIVLNTINYVVNKIQNITRIQSTTLCSLMNKLNSDNRYFKVPKH